MLGDHETAIQLEFQLSQKKQAGARWFRDKYYLPLKKLYDNNIKRELILIQENRELKQKLNERNIS